MKTFLTLTMVIVLGGLAGCATAPPLVGPQFATVNDANGKAAATVDTQKGEVYYHESKDEAFKACFGGLWNYATQMNCTPKPKPEEEKLKDAKAVKKPEQKSEKKK